MCSLEIKRLTSEDLPALIDWRMEVLRDVFSDYNLDERQWERLKEANLDYYRRELARESTLQ